MFDPDARLIYLQELQPPPGYRLDRAVGTTFSLDLLALLMAPLSMALQQARRGEEILRDPVALLEALKRTAGRITVFCQRGRIAIPKDQAPLYSYLEPIVVPVEPPREGAVFHPKTWLLRFIPINDQDPVIYRFLCLSRNLTFDRSWDTALSLEGTVTDEPAEVNRPLVSFLEALPGLAVSGVRPESTTAVNTMTDELRRVHWEVPDEFVEEGLTFHPLGLDIRHGSLDHEGFRRVMVVSPFLTAEGVSMLRTVRQRNVLVSRQDSLDELSDEVFDELQSCGEVYCLADLPDETPEGTEEIPIDEIEEDTWESRLSGLHAKLYVGETGWKTRLLTGSANATSSGLGEANVELLVELWTRRRHLSIDKLMDPEDSNHGFSSLLAPYDRANRQESDPAARKLEQQLELARRQLCRMEPHGHVEPGVEEGYSLEIRATTKGCSLPTGISGRCRPISLPEESGRDLTGLFQSQPLRFPDLSLPSLTQFLAIELTGEHEGHRQRIGFVMNLPVEGMPASRDQAVLRAIISDRERFLRYLMFILAGDEDLHLISRILPAGDNGSGQWRTGDHGLPLLEELLRAFSRYPEKMDRVTKLVDDLQAEEDTREVLPEEFLKTWQVFRQARGGQHE